MIYLFLIALFLIFYSFFGYPLTLFILAAAFFRGQREKPTQKELPSVMLVFVACSEGRRLVAKIKNCTKIDYPPDKLEIVGVSDAATPETLEVLKKAQAQGKLRLLENPNRSGKVVALKKALETCNTDIFIVTDADTLLEPHHIKQLVKPFADPRVGATTGVIRYLNVDETGVSRGQGLYWRFEILTRKVETLFGKLVSLTGAVYTIRPQLFHPTDPCSSDDFTAALQSREQGRDVLLVDSVVAYDYSPTSSISLLRRRVRIMTRGIGLVMRNPRYLNPFRFPLLAWQLWSHKMLRWLSPLFLILILISSFFLVGSTLGQITLAAQILFYLLGLLGGMLSKFNRKLPLISTIWYFLLTGAASLIALFNVIRGKHYAVWQETARR